MPQEDWEDLNVANLTETKSHRTPTSESVPHHPIALKKHWPKAIFIGALGCLIAVAFIVARRHLTTVP